MTLVMLVVLLSNAGNYSASARFNEAGYAGSTGADGAENNAYARNNSDAGSTGNEAGNDLGNEDAGSNDDGDAGN